MICSGATTDVDVIPGMLCSPSYIDISGTFSTRTFLAMFPIVL